MIINTIQMRRPIAFILFILSIIQFSTAQNAPNFTITTTDGQSRKLYEDYLNQGKTVMLKFFFTSCPFCIDMSPKVQKLYEKWGKGTNGVEFISLATLQSNTNALVKTYKTTYGETFLGAGSDGGSITAIAPYTSSQFGPYYGTPSFAIIGPDKKVIWNPYGATYDATIDSLDKAIASTRPSFENITGIVTNACGKPVKNIEIKLLIDGVDTLNTFTDSLGKYKLVYPTNSNSTSSDKFRVLLSANYNSNNLACVSTADLVAINKHILLIDTSFTPKQKLASDVNEDKKVSTADMVAIRKVILLINDSFNKRFSIVTDSAGLIKPDSVWRISKTSSPPYNYLNFGLNFMADVNCSCEIKNLIDPIEQKIKQLGIIRKEETLITNPK